MLDCDCTCQDCIVSRFFFFCVDHRVTDHELFVVIWLLWSFTSRLRSVSSAFQPVCVMEAYSLQMHQVRISFLTLWLRRCECESLSWSSLWVGVPLLVIVVSASPSAGHHVIDHPTSWWRRRRTGFFFSEALNYSVFTFSFCTFTVGLIHVLVIRNTRARWLSAPTTSHAIMHTPCGHGCHTRLHLLAASPGTPLHAVASLLHHKHLPSTTSEGSSWASGLLQPEVKRSTVLCCFVSYRLMWNRK